ncbi:hypothetical protein Tco_0771795 [Tanacetum coccineum]|uniref:Uncharacterized protein n=1 Tax=Tanacetum coccineum TaxID=301880 RepID=A0ABQ4ZG32_9ASTR
MHESSSVEFLCLSTLKEQFKDIKSTIIVASMVDEVFEVAEMNEQIKAKEISYTRDKEGSTHDSTVLPLSLPPPPPFPVVGNAYLQVRVASLSQYVSLSYSSSNKAFQVMEDPPCLKPFLNGKHELLASFDIFPCLKPCVQTQIHPVNLEFLDLIVQCLINLLQSVVTELVDLIKPHDHLNPIFIPKCDGSWRVNYDEVVLELKTSCIPLRFGEV